MKYLAAVVLALLISGTAMSADLDRQKATASAKSWLALIDAGNYAQSWKAASTLFKGHITGAQWESAVKAARGPLGPVMARNPAGIDFETTLPGAPDGQYAVIKFDTRFRDKAAASETVTMAMDGGNWKTAGYYVR